MFICGIYEHYQSPMKTLSTVLVNLNILSIISQSVPLTHVIHLLAVPLKSPDLQPQYIIWKPK